MPLPGLSHVDDRHLFTANSAVVPAWLLLVIAPGWRRSRQVALTTAVLFATFYSALMSNAALNQDGGFSVVEFMSWDGVARLLALPSTVLPAWVHYITFDLLIGRWEVQDAVSRGVPQVLMAPVLVLTFAFGPAGFLVYLLVLRPWFPAGPAAKQD